MRKCTARVWASGDSDNCDRDAVIDDRCLEHRDSEIAHRQKTIRELGRVIAENQARLAVLTDETAEDTHALAASPL